MPKGFTDQEKKNIELSLISAGKDAFGRFGIKKTNVDELAKAAGISKGAFYMFFQSKEDLYFAILRYYETEIHRTIFKLIDNDFKDEQKKFKNVMKEIIATIEDDFFFQRLLAKKDYEYLRRRLSPEQVQEALQSDIDFASRLAGIWKSKGKLRVDDTELITGVLRGIFILFLHKEDVGMEKFPDVIDLLIDASIERLIKK